MTRRHKTYKFSQPDLDKLKISFDSMDSDKNGTLDRDEVNEFAKHNGFDGSFVKLLFLLFDKDKSGDLTFKEFLDFIGVMRLSEKDPRLFYRRVFDAIDTNKGGSLDKHEIASFCDYIGQPVTLTEAEALVKKYDRAGTNSLTFTEICAWLEKSK